MMCAAAGFHLNQAARKVGEERCDLVTPQLLTQHHLSSLVRPVDLKYVPGQVEPNCRNLHGGR